MRRSLRSVRSVRVASWCVSCRRRERINTRTLTATLMSMAIRAAHREPEARMSRSSRRPPPICRRQRHRLRQHRPSERRRYRPTQRRCLLRELRRCRRISRGSRPCLPDTHAQGMRRIQAQPPPFLRRRGLHRRRPRSPRSPSASLGNRAPARRNCRTCRFPSRWVASSCKCSGAPATSRSMA